MIEYVNGNLLAADADVLVNTVNTQGVMGKGVALQFRRAFPDNYRAYRSACAAGEVRLGRLFVFPTGRLLAPHLIVNLPTKSHWKLPSRLCDIDAGLGELRRVLLETGAGSVAVPPLGCGNGGLRWSEVRPRIAAALADLPLRALVFEPDASARPRS